MTTLYNGKYNLKFDKTEHKYLIDDKKIPSVTTILNHDEKELSEKAYLARAVQGLIGEKFHKWAESIINNSLFGLPISPKPEGYLESQCCRSFDWFLKYTEKINWIDSERFVYSPTHNYCGTLDAADDNGSVITIWDFKTAVRKKTEEERILQRLSESAQTWAYQQALIEESIYPDREIRRRVLWIDKVKGTSAQVIDFEPEEGREYWESQLCKWNRIQKESIGSLLIWKEKESESNSSN